MQLDYKYLLGLLLQFLNSEAAIPLYLTIGAWLTAKLPFVANILKWIVDDRIQRAVNRVFEEVNAEFGSVKTVEEVKKIYDEVFRRVRLMFPETEVADEKLKGMVAHAVYGPATSDVKVRQRAIQ